MANGAVCQLSFVFVSAYRKKKLAILVGLFGSILSISMLLRGKCSCITRREEEQQWNPCLVAWRRALDGKLELLALEDLVVVNVEEIAVQNSLDETSNDGDPISLVVRLDGVTVDPVGDVQGAVDTEGEEVVSGDCLCFTGALKHEELGQNCDRLEPNGKGPEDLRDGVGVWEDDGEDGGTGEEVLHLEGIDVGIVGRLVCVCHEVHNVSLGTDEHDLEDEVVEGVRREEIYRAGVLVG